METQRYNVVYFKWSELASGIYFYPVYRIKAFAEATAKLFLNSFLIEKIENEVSVHLIGHSLGGPFAAAIGQAANAQSDGLRKLRRITGLDPAGFWFHKLLFTHRLSKKDAHFVDIINTDSGLLGWGYPRSEGHANFFPNGGTKVQPRCKKYSQLTPYGMLCSHIYAIKLYAMSLSKNYKFTGYSAKSWKDFKEGNYEPAKTAELGANCLPGTEGNFYLHTSADSPFEPEKTVTLMWGLKSSKMFREFFKENRIVE